MTPVRGFQIQNHSRLSLPDVPHHDVDEGVLDEAEEHEQRARRHKHVYRLNQK